MGLKKRIISAIIPVFFFSILTCVCYGEEGDHVALWAGYGAFTIDAPASTDNTEKAAYIEAVSSAETPSGNAVGIFVDTSLDFLGIDGIGIGLARSQGQFDINQSIDIQSTPSDFTDDVLVSKATRFSSNCVIFLKTIDFLTFGLGTEDGYFVFETTPPSGISETKTFSFSYSYLHVSIAFILGDSDGPYISLVTNLITTALPNMQRGDFSGSTNAIILGWIF